MTQPHIRKGTEIKTIGDLIDAMCALGSPDEAQKFMAGYVAVNKHAHANVGYCTGYLDNERGQQLREWCQAAHPIFGMGTPTVGEALTAGEECAAAAQQAGDDR
jgi:hypothetical protein